LAFIWPRPHFPAAAAAPRNHCILSRVTDATGSAASLDSRTPPTKAAEKKNKKEGTRIESPACLDKVYRKLNFLVLRRFITERARFIVTCISGAAGQ